MREFFESMYEFFEKITPPMVNGSVFWMCTGFGVVLLGVAVISCVPEVAPTPTGPILVGLLIFLVGALMFMHGASVLVSQTTPDSTTSSSAPVLEGQR
jgi:hypothetical protein